jgi:hypothetical protein
LAPHRVRDGHSLRLRLPWSRCAPASAAAPVVRFRAKRGVQGMQKRIGLLNVGNVAGVVDYAQRPAKPRACRLGKAKPVMHEPRAGHRFDHPTHPPARGSRHDASAHASRRHRAATRTLRRSRRRPPADSGRRRSCLDSDPIQRATSKRASSSSLPRSTRRSVPPGRPSCIAVHCERLGFGYVDARSQAEEQCVGRCGLPRPECAVNAGQLRVGCAGARAPLADCAPAREAPAFQYSQRLAQENAPQLDRVVSASAPSDSAQELQPQLDRAQSAMSASGAEPQLERPQLERA